MLSSHSIGGTIANSEDKEHARANLDTDNDELHLADVAADMDEKIPPIDEEEEPASPKPCVLLTNASTYVYLNHR